MAAPKEEVSKKAGHPSIPYVAPVNPEQLHSLSQAFEKEHQKNVQSLATLNAALNYLNKYWGFYLTQGGNATIMNDKIMAYFDDQVAHSECHIMYQLAINAREVLLDNKIALPYGDGDEPGEVELRKLLPKRTKVIAPETPPTINASNNQIFALFAALQNENTV
eukprot:CAMPEP_0202711232 /NCGR_PEP_ID=MMETSP1385-20130828/23076_1 /ASSEMBLY_ACC=CAM_ASM_000861 /TAXON_ID=933848 /ORGANISM="Elphidium margaritaceum" /LENGTH=163 /DNA_ID=CAMNT_0049370919 /DNA_START=26 /DNA_END=517 /DNA_ORIENTATION=-